MVRLAIAGSTRDSVMRLALAIPRVESFENAWVLSLPFGLRFLLATDPAALTQVLGIVYRTISAYVLKSARLTRASGATGAVTLIQRFVSALNLDIHFHMLVLGGAYRVDTEPAVFAGSRRRAWRNYKRSWSGWPSASAAHSNTKA